jgi:hypothetical protein
VDKIEKMIKENRDLFRDQEPTSGHFERFESRLKRQNGRRKTIKLTYRISRIAAVGLLMLMSSMWAYNEFISPENNFMNLGDVSQEYQEVEFFFTSQINSKYEALKDFDFSDDESFKDNMLLEIDQMDSVYIQLQTELGTNPGDERIVQAMIRHYQTKLSVISEILNKLETYQEYNTSKTNNQNQYESVKL